MEAERQRRGGWTENQKAGLITISDACKYPLP